ncbi:MAG: hypothetical protein NTZ40_15250 [Cyanobacteria bacterium]|nr:hypothetical protein [Cyanobacteriota bacterium]
MDGEPPASGFRPAAAVVHDHQHQGARRLLRYALTGEAPARRPGAAVVAGFRPFAASDQQLVSNEQIDQLRDLEGI